jgi:HEAT repeat protein
MPRTRLLAAALAALLIVPFADPAAEAADDRAKKLKSKDVLDRLEVVQDLKQNGGEGAEELLLQALKDKDWEVVEWAAEGLGEQGTVESVHELADLAVDGPIRSTRLTAARSAAKLDMTAAADRIQKKAGGKKAEAACEALALLAAHDGERPSDALAAIRKGAEKGMRSEEANVRRAATRCLPAYPPVTAASMVQKLLADEDIGVRAAVLDGVRARPDDAFLEPLLVGLRDPELNDVVERRIG